MSADTAEFAPDIVAFIEARLAERESVIKNTTQGPWKAWLMELLADPVGDSNIDTAIPVARVSSPPQFDQLRAWNLSHIQGWQPLIAQEWVDATRRIIERYRGYSTLVDTRDVSAYVVLGEVLIDLAYVWHSHPDWDESWEVK